MSEMSTKELLEGIWYTLSTIAILKAMEMLKDNQFYFKEQREYLEGLAGIPFEEDDAPSEAQG